MGKFWCRACGGDGGWDDTYIDRSHSVRSDWYDCHACGGTGYIEAEFEPIDDGLEALWEESLGAL